MNDEAIKKYYENRKKKAAILKKSAENLAQEFFNMAPDMDCTLSTFRDNLKSPENLERFEIHFDNEWRKLSRGKLIHYSI